METLFICNRSIKTNFSQTTTTTHYSVNNGIYEKFAYFCKAHESIKSHVWSLNACHMAQHHRRARSLYTHHFFVTHAHAPHRCTILVHIYLCTFDFTYLYALTTNQQNLPGRCNATDKTEISDNLILNCVLRRLTWSSLY